MKKDTGGLAFPSNYIEQHGPDTGRQYVAPGATLRQLYAGLALQGYIASGWCEGSNDVHHAVELAIAAADELIKHEKETRA